MTGKPSLLGNLSGTGWQRLWSCTAILAAGLLAACATTDSSQLQPASSSSLSPQSLQWLDRITWGPNAASARDLKDVGTERFLERQLRAEETLPASVTQQIAGMSFVQLPLDRLVMQLEQQRKEAEAIADAERKKAAQEAYQQALTRVANEAASRSLLRDLYSPNQLQEQMIWFWFNHFNVFLNKDNLRAMVGDFEERAIRPHALGRFRDLLVATMRHPAMLRYLDNEQNAVGHINENYARELMELHTLGVNGGYTQRDVQELARVLTGLGINATDKTPGVRLDLKTQYIRDGLFEFNPNRHDYGDKEFLGRRIHGRGLAEIDEVADLLSRHPSTAQFVSRKLAVYFVADDPPKLLTEHMAATFQRSDGDIAATLRTMFQSPEFVASLGHKFKDPLHFVVSGVRFAYDGKPILNPLPMTAWLNRLGEPLYGRPTPDGYPLTQTTWASAGQMNARFEIARIVGTSSAGLFKLSAADATEQPAFPQMATGLYYEAVAPALDSPTRSALEAAKSPQEWNMFLLASPEFMYR